MASWGHGWHISMRRQPWRGCLLSMSARSLVCDTTTLYSSLFTIHRPLACLLISRGLLSDVIVVGHVLQTDIRSTTCRWDGAATVRVKRSTASTTSTSRSLPSSTYELLRSPTLLLSVTSFLLLVLFLFWTTDRAVLFSGASRGAIRGSVLARGSVRLWVRHAEWSDLFDLQTTMIQFRGQVVLCLSWLARQNLLLCYHSIAR